MSELSARGFTYPNWPVVRFVRLYFREGRREPLLKYCREELYRFERMEYLEYAARRNRGTIDRRIVSRPPSVNVERGSRKCYTQLECH